MDALIKDTLSQHKIMLDQNCKLMISHEEMLSKIIKEFVEETKHLSIEEIIEIVVSWYDNENSYTSQMVRTIKYFAELDRKSVV